MKRSLLILIGALGVSVVVFGGSYLLAQRFCVNQMARPTDDLDWLRQEFHLSETELARVRELHAGYRPLCAEMCEKIAGKKREVEAALEGATNVTDAARQKLGELALLRAQCQWQMLQHFVEVSQAMPAAQGQRYLAEMKRITLGAHEKVEASMSPSTAPAHGHE